MAYMYIICLHEFSLSENENMTKQTGSCVYIPDTKHKYRGQFQIHLPKAKPRLKFRGFYIVCKKSER